MASRSNVDTAEVETTAATLIAHSRGWSSFLVIVILVSVGVTNAVTHPRSQCGEQVVDGGQHFLTASDPDTANTTTLAFLERWS